ncbi:hypothetical protein PIOMA14_I_0170 [Prevotella intermedia]|uniref:Uncharacterized protein n=1 Tax=Prevotella intermedia TaxID=28131 RepID=A0A0S3UGZ3_PREIN|nr:hypothetical protein PIOMA14_I_0170 [Prevotella intermedia]
MCNPFSVCFCILLNSVSTPNDGLRLLQNYSSANR